LVRLLVAVAGEADTPAGTERRLKTRLQRRYAKMSPLLRRRSL
jgi:hypothetical protein